MTSPQHRRSARRPSRLRLEDEVTWQRFDAEAVVLNLRTGRYHGLNDTGGRVLELLAEADGEVEAVTAALAAETGEPAATVDREVRDFLADLQARAIVVEVGPR